MRLELLLDGVHPAVAAAAVQAVAKAQCDVWRREDAVDVVPLEVPDGAWVDIQVPVAGAVGVGVVGERPAMRAPTALLWFLRKHLPAHEQRAVGACTELVFTVPRGVTAWAALPVGGRLGLRLVDHP